MAVAGAGMSAGRKEVLTKKGKGILATRIGMAPMGAFCLRRSHMIGVSLRQPSQEGRLERERAKQQLVQTREEHGKGKTLASKGI